MKPLHINLPGMLLAIAAAPVALAAESAHPQLTAVQAEAYSYTEVLKYTGAAGHEKIDPWDPLADPIASGEPVKPDYTVDANAHADGVTVFNTVQEAVNRAVIDSRAANDPRHRLAIRVKPGLYRELVFVPEAPAAITLYSTDPDASHTRISADLDASVHGADYANRFDAQFAGVDPAIADMHAWRKQRLTLETVATSTVWVKNDGFQARNITFENAYEKEPRVPASCGANCKGPVVHHQAVALMVEGADKAQFENVRLIGGQDTLYLKSAAQGVTARSFFDRSYVEGNVDFIFGETTAYFLHSEIKSLGDRSASYATAPDTNYATRYGFVFNACKFTNDGSANALEGKFFLGRQWFHSQKCTPYGTMPIDGYACTVSDHDGYSAPVGTISKTVLETVGKVAILNSEIGAHIDRQHPWSDWNRNGTLPYRPAQYDSDDYWNNLLAAKIDPVKQLGYDARKTPAVPFLIEYNNTYQRP